MTFVPKKNISSKLHDIKHNPKKSHKKSVHSDKSHFFSKENISHNKKTYKYLLWGAILSVLVFGGIYTITVRNSFADSFNYLKFQTQILKESILGIETEEIKNSLDAINNEIQNISKKADNYGITEFLKIVGLFNSSLKEVPGAFKSISDISDRSLQIASDINYLKTNALQLIFNQKGEELRVLVNNLQTNLLALEKLNTEFKNQARQIKDLNPKLSAIYEAFDKNYLAINLNIYKAEEVLTAIDSILRSPEETKILLLFQNPTEIRPAGGFIGSFGYITIDKGSIKEIKIEDVYNADRQLNIKVAPPRELSAITPTWGARDANWFFDFSLSAEKVSYFLENSKLFSESGIKFENIIAINTNLLASFLEITGPIEIPEYSLTIDRSNFLKEIQYEIEAGRDHKPGQNPKKVLSYLAPLLIDKLKNLDNEGKIKMISMFKEASSQKDIMGFSKNTDVQKIFLQYDLAGESFSIPENWNGDYLAIVNANIAGGKSDAFITQKIQLDSQIFEDGTISNNLIITRSHNGQSEKDWWYTATNKNYVKILTPKQSELISIKGNVASPYKYISPAKSLVKDIDLVNMENGLTYNEEFKIWHGGDTNKNILGTWFVTSAGKTSTLELGFKQNEKIVIDDEVKFIFILDKQSGVGGSFEYKITAPPGYVWKESGKATFSYGTQQILSRETIQLTLKKQNLSQ
ncbi:MAG: DUF4012 domain-containing protein [Minisyncoccota bacterium]